MRRLCLFALLALALLMSPAASQQRRTAPKLEPVAETKLLMEGLADANLRGLEKILSDRPAEVEAWRFARGQALLLAETGNLLLMRPPRTQAGQDTWLDRAAELRDTASKLARTISTQDLARSRTGVLEVAGACNRCHAAFGVAKRLRPFANVAAPIEYRGLEHARGDR